MYRIIIADDEDVIREGLSNTVPWDILGFEVVGLAKDGLEVIELVKTTNPDVILTDIRMPNFDGLKLSKLISNKYPKIKIVILSGYSEVAYYQDAIKNKVVAYLSKPTDYNEFEQEFKKLKILLDEEVKIDKENKKMQEYLKESLPQMRERFFLNILTRRIEDTENMKHKLDFYDIKIPESEYVMMVIAPDDYYSFLKDNSQENGYLLIQTIIFLTKKIFNNSIFFYFDNHETIVGACECSDLTKKITKLQEEFYKIRKMSISVGISTKSESVSEIANKFDEATQALMQKTVLGKNSIIFFSDISNLIVFPIPNIRPNMNKMKNVMQNKDKDEIDKEISEMFSKFEDKLSNNYEYIDKICLELLFMLERTFGTEKVTLNNFLSLESASLFDIFKIDTITAKKRWLLNIITGFIESSNKEKKNKMNSIIIVATEYIEKNYMHNNISLDLVADIVGKNPSYLSNLFKIETGKNFSEFVTELRIEKGKYLLSDLSIKIYEISSSIGYADVSNFTKVFRKYVGLSPGEYRNKLFGNGDENEEFSQ